MNSSRNNFLNLNFFYSRAIDLFIVAAGWINLRLFKSEKKRLFQNRKNTRAFLFYLKKKN